jgi:Tfp pilus assembly PilM family ATPase
MLPARRSPIGLDLGPRTVRAVQLAGDTVVASYARDRIQPGAAYGAEELQLVAAALERRGFRGRRVVVAMPDELTVTQLLALPPAKSHTELARAQLCAAQKLAPNELEVATWPLPADDRGGKKQRILATACRRDDAVKLLETLERGGLEPAAIDAGFLTAVRAAESRLEGLDGVAALLRLDWSTASFVLLQGGAVAYERPLPELGIAPVHRGLVEALEVEADVVDYVIRTAGLCGGGPETDLDAGLASAVQERLRSYTVQLVSELRVSFDYATQETGRVSALVVVGEGGGWPGLSERLARELSVDLHTVRVPLGPADVSLWGEDAPHSFAMAAGLARYPWSACA